ncbi:hypothetical protein [Sphingobacterium kitahiroshimense]|uniref:Uncharacterized protein n=1 Tax=Sphingobacterium kitahiroshimense TaxID=470446 RepID=A0ABV0BWX7_9SPHI
MALFQITDPDHPADPASYSLITGTPPSCTGNEQICTINATNDSGQPVLDTSILSEMVTALNTGVNQPNVNLKA